MLCNELRFLYLYSSHILRLRVFVNKAGYHKCLHNFFFYSSFSETGSTNCPVLIEHLSSFSCSVFFLLYWFIYITAEIIYGYSLELNGSEKTTRVH